ncbi:glycosyl transferase family protein [Streptococcus pneumoniae]|nr:hypothetical protein [Streptococcus pneumoniae]VLT49755.1 glycosyl transferase family protein [Streptococcus pneumoniae]
MSDNCYYMHVWEQDYYEKIWTSQELITVLPNIENYDSSYTVSWGKLFKRFLFDEYYLTSNVDLVRILSVVLNCI